MISFNGAIRLKKRALGYICNHGTIEEMDYTFTLQVDRGYCVAVFTSIKGGV